MHKLDHIFGIGPLWGLTWVPPAALVFWASVTHGQVFNMDFLAVPLRLGCGFLLAVLGFGFVLWSVRTLRRYRVDKQLCTAGPYANVRHPLYAVWIWLLGPSIAFFANTWLAFALSPFAAVTLQFLVGREEAKLEAAYGDEYRAYCSRVGGVIPRLGRASPVRVK